MSYILPAGSRRVDWIAEMEKTVKGDAHKMTRTAKSDKDLKKTSQDECPDECVEEQVDQGIEQEKPSQLDIEIADEAIENVDEGEDGEEVEMSQQDKLLDAIKDLPELKDQISEILTDVEEQVQEIAEETEGEVKDETKSDESNDDEVVKEVSDEKDNEEDNIEIEIKDDEGAVDVSQENDEIEIEIDDEGLIKEDCGVVTSSQKTKDGKKIRQRAQNQSVKQTVSDPQCSPDILDKVLKSSNNNEIMKLAIQNPNTPINTLYDVARNPSTPPDVLMALAQKGGKIAGLASQNPGFPKQHEASKATEVGPEDIVKKSDDKVAKNENNGFIKIAKLSPENRKALKSYWLALGFPSEYVEAMVKDYK
jgi:hypothetical protein